MENQDNRPVEEPVVAQETKDYALGLKTEAGTETETEGAAEAEEVAEIFSNMPSEEKAKRKKGKKRGKDRDRSAGAVQEEAIGTTKSMETMFHNTVRSEMGLLALAATKANIVVSFNGFIVPTLMISGAFISSSSPEFLIPASTFTITAAASIMFALLSASSDHIGKIQATCTWLKDFICRRTTLKNRETRASRAETRSFGGSQLNILIYEDRAKAQKEWYWKMMQEIMSDRRQVYHKMSDHLYWLGLLADKQFRHINLPYVILRWELLASLTAFIGVKTLLSLLTSPTSSMAELHALGINVFNGVYESSAVQQLPDDELLIAGNEPNYAFSIISIGKTNRFIENETLDVHVITGFKCRLSGLEALIRDDEGFICALTSHSHTYKGNRSPDHEHLMRFRIQDGNVLGLTSYDSLTQALETDCKLHDFVRERTKAEVSFERINIEGVVFDPVKRCLVLGFRDPESNNMALAAFISSPKNVFERNAQPEFDEVVILDTDDDGIRSLNYDPVLENYAIANEVKDEDGQKFS